MVEENIVKSTCGMCFAACGIRIHIAEDKVVRVSGDPDSPINRGLLCPKGLASREFLYHPDRLKHPLKRRGEKGQSKWVYIETKLGRIKQKAVLSDRVDPRVVCADFG